MHVLLAGRIVAQPDQGGASWAVVQWVLGLRALGHRVTVVEQLPAPSTREQTSYARTVERQTGVATLLLTEASPDLVRSIGPVDLLVNLSGVLRDPALRAAAPRRLYVDLDPGFTQVWHAQGADVGLDGHTAYASVGLRLGAEDCPVPLDGRDWIPVLPPLLELLGAA